MSGRKKKTTHDKKKSSPRSAAAGKPASSTTSAESGEIVENDVEFIEGPEDEADTEEQEELDIDTLADQEANSGVITLTPDGEVETEDDSSTLPVPALDLKPAKRTPSMESLPLYLKEISSFPLLDPEEEKMLARRVRDKGDQDAAFRIITSHLRLVVKIAMDFQRRWMQNVLDLIQEGNVGLMKAVTKFDPEKGIKFSYYASFWIKAYILKFIMDNWRMVKIGTTQTQRKLFYNLNKERQRLQALGFDPTPAALSEKLGVSEEEITEMDQRLAKNDMSLNLPLGDDTSATRLDFLPALGPGVEAEIADGEIASLLKRQLTSIRPKLNEKETDILDLRLLSDSPVTLREIGEKYGITRERVRQIENRLLEKLRDHLSREIKDFSPEWIPNKD